MLEGKKVHGKAVEPWSILQKKASYPDPVHPYDLARKPFVT